MLNRLSLLLYMELEPIKVKAMTGLTLEEARLAIMTFKNKVPEVEIFIKTANRVIKERGCVKTYSW